MASDSTGNPSDSNIKFGLGSAHSPSSSSTTSVFMGGGEIVKPTIDESLNRPSLLKSVSTPGKIQNMIPHPKPSLKRTQSIKDRISNETAKFFGVSILESGSISGDDDVQVINDEEERKWQQRRFRHLNKQYRIKTDAVEKELHPKIGIDALTDLLDGRILERNASAVTPGSMSLATRSMDGRRRVLPMLEKRESVAQMTYNAVSSVLHGNAFRRTRIRRLGGEGGGDNGGGNGVDDVIATNLQQHQQSRDLSGSSSTPLSSAAYKPIRERNNCLTNSSFPSNRINAATLEGLAKANQTVRKISGFFSGSNALSGDKTESNDRRNKSPLELEIEALDRISAEELPQSMESASDDKRAESNLFESITATDQQLKSRSFAAEKRKLKRTYAVHSPEDGKTGAEFFDDDPTKFKTLPAYFGGSRAVKPLPRPTYLPLGTTMKRDSHRDLSKEQRRKQKHDRMFISSSSITNDDVFFDIPPPSLSSASCRTPASLKIGQMSMITESTSKPPPELDSTKSIASVSGEEEGGGSKRREKG